MSSPILYELQGHFVYGMPPACPEPTCDGQELERELAADVALDFYPLGEPYNWLIGHGGTYVWHCYGCGYIVPSTS